MGFLLSLALPRYVCCPSAGKIRRRHCLFCWTFRAAMRFNVAAI